MTPKGTILLAEDDAAIRKILVALLRLEGYIVADAPSARVALEILSHIKVDVVLSDIQMPDGDGFSLLRGLQKLQPAPPLIFVSGDEDTSTEDALKQGAAALIRKPVDLEELLRRIALETESTRRRP